jgi:hypothetical protein
LDLKYQIDIIKELQAFTAYSYGQGLLLNFAKGSGYGLWDCRKPISLYKFKDQDIRISRLQVTRNFADMGCG